MEQNLQKGRRTLINSFGGVRYKLKTIDGNFLDSLFIDKRLILFLLFMNDSKFILYHKIYLFVVGIQILIL